MKRQKVLVIADDTSARSMLYTFLTSMQCEGAALSSERALAAIKRQEFDAILLDLRPPDVPAEQLLLGIKEARPGLLHRILAITHETPDPVAIDLIESHGLIRVTQDGLFRQLWHHLQTLLSSRPASVPAVQERRIAELVFDTFRQPLPAGLRGSAPSARHLVYKCENIVVDVLIEPHPHLHRIEMTGQVLSATTWQGKRGDLPVVLAGERGPLASARTNQFGEFSLKFDYAENSILKVRVAADSWVFIYLANMSGAGKQLSRSGSSD